jgi:hypothetical protein
MTERGKAYYTILALYQDRLELEKFPRTPKLQKKIDELRNLEEELKQAMRDHDFVRRLEESAVRRAMERTEQHGQVQREKREKRQTWNGLTRQQLLERDQKIIEHFQRSRKKGLTMGGFSERHAAKYHLSPRFVRLILKKAVGTLPG